MRGVAERDGETNAFDPLLEQACGRVGRVLREKWRLDELLGLGERAAVYRATCRDGSRAAVKILRPELTADPRVRAVFLRECYAASALDHDAATRVLEDDVAEDGSLVLVTELLDGETLEQRRLRLGGRLEEDEVLAVADPLLEALAFAHVEGVVHGGIKPENVLLTRTGRLKVIDFGFGHLRALAMSPAERGGLSARAAAFLPPEQVGGAWDLVTARSDLWAVGATMYALLSGTVPGGRTTPSPPIASVAARVSPACALVVDTALAAEPERRWFDASRMQEAVWAAYHERHGAPISTARSLTVPAAIGERRIVSGGRSPAAYRQRTSVSLRALAGSSRALEEHFVVDAEAVDCLVSAAKLRSIGVEPEGRELYELADGTTVALPYGFARVRFLGSETVTKVTFGPHDAESILGAVALGSTGVGLDPVTRTLRRLGAKPLR